MGLDKEDIYIGSEVLLAIIQLFALAAKRQGLTPSESKEMFDKRFSGFMEESSSPVEPVDRS